MPSSPPADREPKTDQTHEPTPAEEAADPNNAKQPTGDAQAAANRDLDPPA